MSLGHTSAKIISVGLLPARTPKENIKVYDRQTKPLPEMAGYGRLTATGAADDDDAPQMNLPSRLLRGVFVAYFYMSLLWSPLGAKQPDLL